MNFPSLVAAVEIDAKQNKVASQENCTVEGLQATATNVKFKKLDKALPFFPEDASSILPWTPIAEQAKKAKEAVENKNRYHHDQIFRGIVLTGVPEWIYSVVPREQLEEKKNALVNERLEKVAQLDVEVAESLKMKPHQFEIVNAD